MSEESKPARRLKKRWIALAIAALCVGALGAWFRIAYRVYQVPSKAMEPTLRGDPDAGDRILVDVASVGSRPLRRWDVVVFRYPHRRSRLFVSRVAGLPGERIAIREGRLLVDGGPAERPAELDSISYTNLGILEEGREIRVPEGRFFVLGDNSGNARDGRMWQRFTIHLEDGGAIHGELLQGIRDANPAMGPDGESLALVDSDGDARTIPVLSVRRVEIRPCFHRSDPSALRRLASALNAAGEPILPEWTPELALADPEVATVAESDLIGFATRIVTPFDRAGAIR